MTHDFKERSEIPLVGETLWAWAEKQRETARAQGLNWFHLVHTGLSVYEAYGWYKKPMVENGVKLESLT